MTGGDHHQPDHRGRGVSGRDWYSWHADYDRPDSGLARRLAWVQDRIRAALDDAPLTSQYADLAPADLVLACGLFGNMTDADIKRTIEYCTQLCATGGTVVWTRARWEPDLVPQICAWFERRGFEQAWLSDPGYHQCCGAHRFTG